MSEDRTDLVLSTSITALGLAVTIAAVALPAGLEVDPLSPKFIPALVGVFLVFGGMTLVVGNLRSGGAELSIGGVPDDLPGHSASARRALAIVGIAFAYVLLVNYVGFLVGTPGLVFGILWLMDVRSPRLLAAVSIVYPLAIWGSLQLLGIRLPSGLMPI